MYVRDDLWVRSNRLHALDGREDAHDLHLPLSVEEAGQITARLPKSRCFLVHDGGKLPLAVVHLDGGTERVFGHDLRWTTAGLLEQVTGPRTAREVTPGREAEEAFALAREVRKSKQRHEWLDEFWYFGIYASVADASDIGATRILVRTSPGSVWLGERYAGQGRWTRTSALDDVYRGKSYDDDLPLSPAEAKAIVARLG